MRLAGSVRAAAVFGFRRALSYQLTRPVNFSRFAVRSAVTTHPAVKDRSKDPRWAEVEMERYADQADVVVVGGGPAGLTAAIKMKRLANEQGQELRVCVFEKGSEFGRHTLSGACLEPRALYELWSKEELQELDCPMLKQPVTDDKFYLLTENNSFPVPLFDWMPMNNHGNYIVRLGHFVAWLAEQAEAEGVELWPGQAVTETLYHEDGSVKGVASNDVGIGKDGAPKDSFERGMEMHAKITLFAEGCRGSETQKLLDSEELNLKKHSCPMNYGIGMKELWRIDAEKHEPGKIVHTAGWPLKQNEYGGSFLYHIEDDGEPLVALGFVIGLDYQNPYLNTFKTFQKWKTHPEISRLLEGGECLQYGARALNEGGFQAVPELTFPGGLLMGCGASLLNVPKIKGTHLAMKSGIVAGETVFAALQDEERMKEYFTNPAPAEEAETSEDEEEEEEEAEPEFPELHKGLYLKEYQTNMENSWVWEELHGVRNVAPSFHKFKGLFGMMGYTGLALNPITKKLGLEKWTFEWKKGAHEWLKPAKDCKEPDYPAPDGKITFDILTQVSLAGANHEGDQPAHLALKDDSVAVNHNHFLYDGPEGRFCPAGVYEYTTDEETGKTELIINAQNCVHCKTCSIKDPTQNIVWACPEGGGGPAYDGM